MRISRSGVERRFFFLALIVFSYFRVFVIRLEKTFHGMSSLDQMTFRLGAACRVWFPNHGPPGLSPCGR